MSRQLKFTTVNPINGKKRPAESFEDVFGPWAGLRTMGVLIQKGKHIAIPFVPTDLDGRGFGRFIKETLHFGTEPSRILWAITSRPNDLTNLTSLSSVKWYMQGLPRRKSSTRLKVGKKGFIVILPTSDRADELGVLIGPRWR